MYASCEMVGSDLIILGGMPLESGLAPTQNYATLLQKVASRGDKINGHISRKSDTSDLVGARVMQYQSYNDFVEKKTSFTVLSLRSWFRAQNPDLSDLQIIFFNEDEQKVIYCNMFILEQSEVLANCKRRQVESEKGKVILFFTNFLF
jgi:hypothetical protein